MDASLSRASITRQVDPHNWNTWDSYQTIHEIRLAEHSFVDQETPNTLQFGNFQDSGGLSLRGEIYCLRGVVLEVDKWFESRYFGPLRKIRGYSYRYAAWVQGGHPVLRYHNVHAHDDYYHHRIFNPLNGEEVLYERLERYQFPVLSDVLEELEIVTRVLKS